MTLGPNAGGATLSGTTTVTAVNGVATFSDLSVNQPGTYTLQAQTIGLPTATSNQFTVSAPPQQASIGLTPDSGAVGTPVAVRGSGFPAGSTVTIFFDTSALRTVIAADDGSFQDTFNVPSNASSGPAHRHGDRRQRTQRERDVQRQLSALPLAVASCSGAQTA